jgi:hypothetical protein
MHTCTTAGRQPSGMQWRQCAAVHVYLAHSSAISLNAQLQRGGEVNVCLPDLQIVSSSRAASPRACGRRWTRHIPCVHC